MKHSRIGALLSSITLVACGNSGSGTSGETNPTSAETTGSGTSTATTGGTGGASTTTGTGGQGGSSATTGAGGTSSTTGAGGGAAGACTDAADKAALANSSAVDDAANTCGTNCQGASACTAMCMEMKLGISAPCGKCWGDDTACGANKCLIQCIQGGSACTMCVDMYCTPAFNTCAGMYM